jgi:hypothetical protein
MRNRLSGSWLRLALGSMLAVAGATLADTPTQAQTYAPPRTTDGKPDLQGIWQVFNTADVNIQDHAAGSDGPGGQGVVEGNEIPYQPWALAKKKENFDKRLAADPIRRCYLPGVPRVTYMPFPFQIMQVPGYVAIAYEFTHASRMIYTNGSKHQEDVEFWMGDSRGHWEGDTLVVDVISHNDQTWFDRAGNFHSEALHVVERYTRTGPDHMQYEATIEDPKVFTRPWKMRMLLYRRKEPNVQLLDYQCYAFDHDKKGLSIPLAR